MCPVEKFLLHTLIGALDCIWMFSHLQTKSSKSVLANNTHPPGVKPSKSISDEDVSSASTSTITTKSSLIPVLKSRRTSKPNSSETHVSSDRSIQKRGPKQKYSSSELEPSTSQESVASTSGRSTYRQKLRSPKARNYNANKRQAEEDSRSRSRTDSGHREGSVRKRSAEKYKTKSTVRTLSTSESSTSSVNATVPQATHKYPLRNRLLSSSVIVPNNRVSVQDPKTKESVALGASTSHQATREEQEPSRLTRSGAVLRRSTRNSKGKTSNTKKTNIFKVSTSVCKTP